MTDKVEFDRRMLEALVCPLTQGTLRYDADRQGQMRAALHRIMAAPGLSRDLSEMAGRMLAG